MSEEYTKESLAWGIVDPSIDAVEWFRQHLSHGKGDVHCVWIPEHPKSSGIHSRPDHAVLLAITGNGPRSEANAKRIVDIWVTHEIIRQGGHNAYRQMNKLLDESKADLAASRKLNEELKAEMTTLKSLEQQAWHKAQFELERAAKAEAKSAKDIEWAKTMRHSYEEELTGLKQLLRIERDNSARAEKERDSALAKLAEQSEVVKGLRRQVERLCMVHVPAYHEHETETIDPDGDCWVCHIQSSAKSEAAL